MSSVQYVNPNAQVLTGGQALMVNIHAARGLQNVLRSNLGPKGTLKMLVSGAGDIKITKDGNILLGEMQIQLPTAIMIARMAGAQDRATGDGTTSCVLLVGELMRQAERLYGDGVHQRVIVDGFEKATAKAIEVLDSLKIPVDINDREMLFRVAQTSLRTKLEPVMADRLTDIVVDAVRTVHNPESKGPIDLNMVELMHMQHRRDKDTKLVRGLVLDHGARHPDMPKELHDAFILAANVSLEFETSEVNSQAFYKTAQQRDEMAIAERKFTDDRVRRLIDFAKMVCSGENANKKFVLINMKGIDAVSLDMLARAGILALRRCKRRNLERLRRVCNCSPVNSFDDLSVKDLGWAGHVYQQTLGEDKYTFVEDVEKPTSCSILIKGPNPHTIRQIKDAVRDGLKAVRNVLEDKFVVPGAGAFEAAAYNTLMAYRNEVKGRTKLGIQAFAESLLVIPKVLAENAGFDAQDAVIALQEDHLAGKVTGLNLDDAENYTFDPVAAGVLDNYRVKSQGLTSSAVIAAQLLLVDEILRAGRSMQQQGPGGPQ